MHTPPPASLVLLASLAGTTTGSRAGPQAAEQAPAAQPARAAPVLKVAVVNGLARRGPWNALAEGFSAAGTIRIETIAGQRETVAAALKEGRADVALLHRGAESDALVKSGTARPAVAWAASGFVLIGPQNDPAGIRGSKTAAAAMRLILAKSAPLAGPDGQGTRAMYERALTAAGVKPPDGWAPLDPEGEALPAAIAAKAYTFSPAHREGLADALKQGMEIFVADDPALRLEFVALIAANSPRTAEAEALLKFLTDKKTAPLFAGKPDPAETWLNLVPVAPTAGKTP